MKGEIIAESAVHFHRKIPNRNFAVNVSGGWHSHLAILQYKAEGKVPPAFWDVWRETEGVYEKRY